MKLAYVTTFDARDLSISDNWAGTGYYIPESLKKQSIPIQYIGSLKEQFALQIICKLKRHYHELFSNGSYLKTLEPLVLKNYANRVSQALSKIQADIVFSATATPIAYLECKQPIVFWADATFENLLNFYPQFTGLCQETIQHGHMMERLALQNCKLAIYSSEWAARSAIDYYQTDPSKVKVVPFGANIETNKSVKEIKDLIESRPSHKCKLLFLGIDWFRKGGDIALEVAKKLNHLGLETELTVVGGQPVVDEPLPDFVKLLGFISKSTDEGKEKIYQLIANSHFLILPSLADCTPIVFCEANSLGVPCLSRKVGGIPTTIKADLNGKLFDKDAEITEYCDYISRLFTNYSDYKNLAFSSLHEYQSRLNWSVAGQSVKKLLIEIVA
jgi:glycosyltransferase involved in cell wall biosynthesis